MIPYYKKQNHSCIGENFDLFTDGKTISRIKNSSSDIIKHFKCLDVELLNGNERILMFEVNGIKQWLYFGNY